MLFWKKRTNKGRVVYPRKKHTWEMRDTQRVVMMSYEKQQGDGIQWRYVFKLSEAMYKHFMEAERYLDAAVDRYRRMDCEDVIVRVWNDFFNGILQAWQAAERLGFWIPYVGAVLSAGKLILEYVYDQFGQLTSDKMEEAAERYEPIEEE